MIYKWDNELGIKSSVFLEFSQNLKRFLNIISNYFMQAMFYCVFKYQNLNLNVLFQIKISILIPR